MKRIKICALALSSCVALGVLAGCNNVTPSETGAPSSSEATASESIQPIVFPTDSDDTKATEVPTVTEVTEATEVTAETEETTKATNPTKATSKATSSYEVIVFSGDEQTRANTFISNFAETYFPNYDRSTATLETYLDFVHMHLKINSDKSIKYDKKGELSFETFTVETAQSVIGKYFTYYLKDSDAKGLHTPPDAYGDHYAGPYYEDGRIWYQGGAGESYTLIGIVDFASNNGDGTLTLSFTIYSIDLDTYNKLDSNGLKAYYKLTPDKAKKDKTLTKVKTGVAKVDVGQSGSYLLINYKTA